ncbi:hypothetical protein PLAN_20054 [Planktothrix rubescens CCAP 1459/22]|uniref:Uncharacterized protein n=1 Tax=Planktothrix rubescens CCAP 1459/22 TaxID=329571 RepID=A0A6J7ZJ83_PLARU|nr:hypothetical protein PLAN_20054 [Planktothrix rubescens NIVA-CYA 18]
MDFNAPLVGLSYSFDRTTVRLAPFESRGFLGYTYTDPLLVRLITDDINSRLVRVHSTNLNLC